jgi:putative transposase
VSYSHCTNQNGFTNFKFAWQTGYGAFSISESMIEDVKKYILNQKEHHKNFSFQEEFDRFEKKYGYKNSNR